MILIFFFSSLVWFLDTPLPFSLVSGSLTTGLQGQPPAHNHVLRELYTQTLVGPQWVGSHNRPYTNGSDGLRPETLIWKS